MTRLQKLTTFLWGLGMLFIGLLMLLAPEESYMVVVLTLSLGFIFYGIKQLIYYFTMARFMVGGKEALYRGVIILDLGFFTASLTDVPKVYILLYLVLIHAFSGLVEILRVWETRKNGGGLWKLKLFHGVLNVAMALVCIIFIRKPNTAVYIYSLGLIYSAVIRIITSFRKTGFIYIQ
ncbi:MAG: DUF308 domain-containing protein [Butyrivibrio sp.]|nr:DUF308 domain-containing protein [Butyrivibrio sp.]